MKTNDLIIIGAGPAGLTASIYASRYRIPHLVIGQELGGELSLAHNVCNYPGFESISGIELAQKWKKQAEGLGAEVLLKEIGRIELNPSRMFRVFLKNGVFYQSKTLIVATGSRRRRLDIPGEEKYLGKGVSYCTTCDAPFYKKKKVVLIGGADSAVTGAIHLAEFAEKIYLIYRREKLRAEPAWVEEWQKIEKRGQGETIYKTNVTQVLGKETVEAVKLDRPHQGSDQLSVDGVFVEIGGVPGTSLVRSLGAELTETGYVKVNDQMETNLPGLFCAGDMTSKSADFKQAITACAQGARAAASAYKFIRQKQAPQILGV